MPPRAVQLLRLLRSHPIPLVVLDRRVPSNSVVQVRSDSEAGAHRLVQHFIELGHRRIGMLTGKRSISTPTERRIYANLLLTIGVVLPA